MTADQSPPNSRAFTSRLREVLTARLPAGPGWVVWVDGVVEELADATPAQGIEIDGGRIQAVWAVFCDACNSWLPEWNRSPDAFDDEPWRDPADYAGQGLCPRCGSGWPCCADPDPVYGFYRHEDTCAKYRWSDDVCGRCSLELAQDEMRRTA